MKAQMFLKTAPIDFDAVVSNMTPEKRQALTDECEALAIAYAERGAYIDARYGYGCGDQGHKAGVNALNHVRKAVRKAFGYTTTTPVNF